MGTDEVEALPTEHPPSPRLWRAGTDYTEKSEWGFNTKRGRVAQWGERRTEFLTTKNTKDTKVGGGTRRGVARGIHGSGLTADGADRRR